MQGWKYEGKTSDWCGQDFRSDRYFSAKLIMIVSERETYYRIFGNIYDDGKRKYIELIKFGQ